MARKKVSSCEGDTWAKCVENLRQFFDWEYDQGKIIRSSLFVLNNSHFMFKN
ncbi:Imm8 family immunity protein [Escherichia fergusonii]|uniref:Imm8 family immunity protein n=1 Tax=Escherichia fergusonii TaxID=564 RepID=UPI0023EE6DE8|nr:Imm8 family immunity protein [Escherichia fergusonii]